MDEWIYIPNNKKIKKWIFQENYNPMDIGYSKQ